MTSVLKQKSVIPNKPYVNFVGGPCYLDSYGNKILFPFTFNNGTLDINPINDFSLTSGDIPVAIGTGDGGLVKLLGGNNLVQNLGPNFKTYIQNTKWDGTSAISNIISIDVYQPGIVTRVQQLDYRLDSNLPQNINPALYTFSLSSNAPSANLGFDYLTNSGVTYAFYKPLIVSVTVPVSVSVPSGIQYLTFYSSWDH